MKSIVVDESLSSNKTNVLFQRILQDFKISSLNSLHFIQLLQWSRHNFYRRYPIHGYYPGNLDALANNNQYSCLVLDHYSNMPTPSSHLSVSVCHT